MFFYPTVLNHRTGRFATIWLAATKGRKISRRDLLQVNVQRTCCDIMDFVLVRVPPPMAGFPRPRFSLYLSSQLQYGVVLVYHRQCEFLLEDTQGAIDRLLRLNRMANIDLLDEETRQSHVIPDAVELYEETQGVRDPFFGVMETKYDLPSPSSLIQRQEQVLPEYIPSSREPTPPSDGITASQESITLTETEPVIMPEPEFEGTDLLESDILELLLEQPDHFLEQEEERPLEIDREREQIETEEDREPRMPDEREQERAVLERETARDRTISASLDLAQTTGASSQEAVLLPEEDLGLPMEMPVLEEREKTPVSVSVPIPSPPAEEEEMAVELKRERSPRPEPAALSPEPAKKRKRRRQLLFFDEHTQISQEEMRARIGDVETMTRPLSTPIKATIETKHAKELLTNPCMRLPPEILVLWKQAAVVRPIRSSMDRREVPGAEETAESEREEERPEPPEREEERELSPKEILREMVEPELLPQDTPASLVFLETTDKDVSPLETPEMRRSPLPEIQLSLEDIPEERVPEMEEIPMDVVEEELMPQDVLEDLVTFQSLLPPQARRRIVAQMFWSLLEQTVAGEITVRQDIPYGDIIILQP